MNWKGSYGRPSLVWAGLGLVFGGVWPNQGANTAASVATAQPATAARFDSASPGTIPQAEAPPAATGPKREEGLAGEGELPEGPEEPQPEAGAQDEFADVPWWQGFGVGMLTLPAPTAPQDRAHLVVARESWELELPDLEGGQAHTVTATLAFYEIQNDLQMQLDFTEPLSYHYLGVTGPQQCEFSIPGTQMERARRFPVERCGLIHVLAMNAEGSTRLIFTFTPAGAMDFLNEPGTEPLCARIYKGPGRTRGPRRAKQEAPVKAAQIGLASWYGSRFQGRRTASGEPFNMYAYTAAHRTLPLGTKARVTNLQNGKSTVVRINDRGPSSRRRILDVSRGVAERLGFRGRGTARVKVEVLGTKKDQK